MSVVVCSVSVLSNRRKDENLLEPSMNPKTIRTQIGFAERKPESQLRCHSHLAARIHSDLAARQTLINPHSFAAFITQILSQPLSCMTHPLAVLSYDISTACHAISYISICGDRSVWCSLGLGAGLTSGVFSLRADKFMQQRNQE